MLKDMKKKKKYTLNFHIPLTKNNNMKKKKEKMINYNKKWNKKKIINKIMMKMKMEITGMIKKLFPKHKMTQTKKMKKNPNNG